MVKPTTWTHKLCYGPPALFLKLEHSVPQGLPIRLWLEEQFDPFVTARLVYRAGAETPLIGNENSAQSFSDRSFWKSLGVVDVRAAFRSWMSAPKCLFSHGFEGPDRSFGTGYPREWPPDVRGISGLKTSSLGWFFVPDLNFREKFRVSPRRIWKFSQL